MAILEEKSSKKYTAIIDLLKSMFSALYYIDLEENSLEELVPYEELAYLFDDKEDARASLKRMVDNFVAKEYRAAMRIFIDIDTVDIRLGNKSIIIQEFISTKGDLIRCCFIPEGRSEEEKRNKVFCGFRKLFDENAALQELAQQEKIEIALTEVERINETLRDEMEIAEVLSKDYTDVMLIDMENDTSTTIKMAGKIYPENERKIRRHYNETWDNYISKYVIDEDREELRAAVATDVVQRELEKSDEYICSYRVRYDDTGIHHFQVIFMRMYSWRTAEGFIILGFRNVDLVVEQEQRHMKMQEMALKAAYEAAEAANKAKTEFLSNMSHDIRTQMNGIIGMTNMALAHIDDKERVQDCLQKITKASNHMLSLINEVLDMSKIESGKVDLVEEKFNLSELFDNLVTMTNSLITEHQHEFSVNISGVIHEAVVGDSFRIQKIFMNLISNAVKFTPDGGKISLSVMEKPCNQEKVGCYEFIFEDNGIGMSEEFIEKIFEPFVRATDRRVSKIQGTGLGMAISRNIARMMGGDITVESKLGVGSRFTVTIYLKLQDVKQGQFDRFKNLDVLVIDDNSVTLKSCCKILNDFGMRVDSALTTQEAIEQINLHNENNRDYFACILDWRMPDNDGIENIKEIRRTIGDDVPIIIAEYDWSDIEQDARAVGADGFINKPLFRSRLVNAFDALVEEEEQKDIAPPFVELEDMDLSNYRALLVEDNEINAEIAIELLGMTGLVIEQCWNGAEAVDKILECDDGHYNIIFMDIQMPKMNGYDATKAIRAMNRDYCKKVPIIAMTANAFADDVQDSKNAGMNEHIAKPIDLKILSRALEKWLK